VDLQCCAYWSYLPDHNNMYHGIQFWTYDVGGHSALTHQVTPAHIMG